MDCCFATCSIRENIAAAAEKMARHNYSALIVVDDTNSYKGVITAAALLGHAGRANQAITPLVQEVPPVLETDSTVSIKKVDGDILPVINAERSVVGIINLRSLVEYLPEALAEQEGLRQGSGRKTGQQTAKYSIDDIVGQSRSILQLKERVIAAAKTKTTVLIMGETGTGKELVAHAIHRLSGRRHHPFVRVNCAAIPENLLESELFGYEPGAFTGAIKGGHIGKFQLADGGTIFLDEIGDMPLLLQAKILRVLQEREIEKIGGRFPIPVDVRVIAATHRNLYELVKEGKFRQDLFYRLHVIPIHMPPLRDHREDIPLLVDYFLDKFTSELNIPKPAVEHKFMQALGSYHWPGNVRELSNVMEAAVSLANGVITVDHLPSYMLEDKAAQGIPEALPLRSYADEAEREAILKAIEMYRGNKIKVSEALGISRSSLYNKLKKYSIDL